MKLALLLPGYLESPDYEHLVVIDKKLTEMGYTVLRVDACQLWSTNNIEGYTLTNYIKQVEQIIGSYSGTDLEEVVLIGHSLGASVAMLVGVSESSVSRVVCLSPAVVLNKSREKWNTEGIRLSKKDLPGRPTEFREFAIPIFHMDDRIKYNIGETLKNFKKPLMFLFGSEDSTAQDIQKVADTVDTIHVVKIDGMNHDFRNYPELCNLVSEEIKSFLLFKS